MFRLLIAKRCLKCLTHGELRYDGGQLSGIGSPVIAMRKAQEHKEKVSKFLCLFIEKNKDNFENLCSIIEKEKSSCSHPIIGCANGDFETEIIKLLDEKHDKLPPTFCFIDPFGFDAPFYVIKRLMAIPKTEVFFTFMSRDINRFISSDKHIKSLNKLFGTEEWMEHIQNSSNNYLNEKSILHFYSDRLKGEANIKYTMPFMVKMPEKDQTVYYCHWRSKIAQ